jgi:uncharacterized protein (DUF1800 family)
MANLAPITSWTTDDVLHLGRRAGFGLTPEAAAALAGQDPGATVDAWVDGTGLSTATFDSIWADRADVVWLSAVGAASGGTDVPAVNVPHRFAVDGPDAWRNSFTRAQASWAFRMQYHPYAFAERMALFFTNLFATGATKVGNAALTLQQIATLRAGAVQKFDDLLVSVSKDPAMAIWLDSVLNNAAGSSVPNENYAREVMELYSLGVDNGYNQVDITQLALALSGWSFVVDSADVIASPADPTQKTAAKGRFQVYDGSTLPANTYRWNNLDTPNATVSNRHASGAKAQITFLDHTFDVSVAPTGSGWAKGEDALRSIFSSRTAQAAQFLARRLILHFVSPPLVAADVADVAGLVQSSGFDLRAVMKTLLKSQYFFDPGNRFALVEGPVSWVVRAARMLGMDLATADAAAAGIANGKGFPAWASIVPSFEFGGMKLLDPNGPNGWKEDVGWLNSNTVRYRTRLASALALGETFSQGGSNVPLVPASVTSWFPVAPAQPSDVYDRLVQLLQPAPIPAPERDAWLAGLWPGAFTWDATGQKKARELAFVILCSPSSQVY